MTDDDCRANGMELAGKLFAGIDRDGVKMPDALRGYTMRHVFGDVWQQDGMTLEQRSLVTCTTLVALNPNRLWSVLNRPAESIERTPA